MNQKSIFSAKNLKTIAIITLLFVALSLILCLIQKPKYQSSVRLLTVFNQSTIDPYTASRTSEYITSVLGEVVYSTSFIDNVFKTNFSIKDTLGVSQEKRQKEWKKMVKVKLTESKGILDIDVLHENRDQAYQFAQAITYTIVTKHQLYHGFGDKVSVKIINSPVTSTGWAQPNILKNSIIGLVVGFIFGLTIVVIFPQQNLLGLFSFKIKKLATKDETINLIDQREQIISASIHNAMNQSVPLTTESDHPNTDSLNPTREPAPTPPDQSDDNQYYGW